MFNQLNETRAFNVNLINHKKLDPLSVARFLSGTGGVSASVHMQMVPCGEGRVVRGKEGDGFGHLPRVPRPTQRVRRLRVLHKLLPDITLINVT